MYAGVPIAMPVPVSEVAPAASLSALATPKSITRAWAPAIRMFSGLMSRCTTPRVRAYSRASATSRMMRTASSIGSAPPLASLSRSDAPSTKGIT